MRVDKPRGLVGHGTRQGWRRRAVGSALTAALLGSGLVSAGASSAVAAVETVESSPYVSAASTEVAAGCTVEDTRATKRWWMFGRNIALDFGVKGSAAPKISRASGMAAEGSTVVTDTQGNLRFWSNGIDVWGADGKPIKNSGGGLGKNSANQTVVAMPAMGAPGKYYVVVSGYEAEMGLNKGSLYYSVIDMNANGGKGEMTEKNIPLGTPGVAGEGLSATSNAAGDGFWVYSVAANTNQIYRWEFKANGPVSKTPQAQSMPDQFAMYSSIHFDSSPGSNQGVVLATTASIYTVVTVNRSTGVLAIGHRVHHVSAEGDGKLYGASFSPSGQYLYYSELYGNPSHLYRVDLQKKTAVEVRDSRIDLGRLANVYNAGGGVKVGPDGNMWLNDGDWQPTLVKVTNPDGATPGAMQRVRIDLEPGMIAGWGLPDMVTGCEKRVPQLTATISAPKGLTLGDAISPVKVTVTNTGNSPLTAVSVAGGSATCPKTTLAPNESMSCTATAGHWGSVTQAQNSQGSVKNLTHTISAKGSVGVDHSTGVDRVTTISVTPTMNLPVVTSYTLTFDPAGGTITGATSLTRKSGQAWGTLPTVRSPGNVFFGWHTAPTGGAKITATTLATEDLTAYATWRPAKFNVIFDGNAETGNVTGSTPSASFDSGCTGCLLPTNGFTKSTGAPVLVDRNGGETAEVNSTFLGWSTDPRSRTADIADRAVAGKLSQTDGDTVVLYAIWDDAPRFIVTAYPDRVFSLAQAQSGGITEEALLSTVVAADRETTPLSPVTSEQVAATGSDVGITLYDYVSEDFTSLTNTALMTLTYKVKDAVGHVAFLRITVTVTDDTAVRVDPGTYLRGVSATHAFNEPALGGLAPDSVWRSDPVRRSALERALSAGGPAGPTTYCLSATAVGTLRAQATRSLGNAASPDDLAAAVTVLRDSRDCS